MITFQNAQNNMDQTIQNGNYLLTKQLLGSAGEANVTKHSANC